MQKTIGTPEGTRDRLFAECAACRRVETAVTEVFRRQGYSELTTPSVEYYDIIAATGHPLSQESMMKIVDRTGKILVMRPDNTVAIGRVVASKMKGLPLPLRLYYNQTVFRSDDVHTGARSEIDQCGVELIGAEGLRADLEVISLSISALDACGLEDYHIEIGHAGYFSALVKKLALPEETEQTLRLLLENKELTAYESALLPYRHDPAGKALCRLPRLFGGAEVLDEAEALCTDASAASVLTYLRTLYGVLKDAGLQQRVRFDLSLVHTIEYYTGIVFRGYGQGAAGDVLSGGRYDKLIGQFGAPVPATGFALDVEAVANCLPAPEHKKPETVVYYALDTLGKARSYVNTQPPGTAMLSCADTPEQAREEALTLGAKRLVLLTGETEREELL